MKLNPSAMSDAERREPRRDRRDELEVREPVAAGVQEQDEAHPPREAGAGKCSTVPSLISICVSGLQFAATVEHSEKSTISSQFAFQSSIVRCSKWVSNLE